MNEEKEKAEEKEINVSSDQPAEGDPNAGTGQGISSEKPVEGEQA